MLIVERAETVLFNYCLWINYEQMWYSIQCEHVRPVTTHTQSGDCGYTGALVVFIAASLVCLSLHISAWAILLPLLSLNIIFLENTFQQCLQDFKHI